MLQLRPCLFDPREASGKGHGTDLERTDALADGGTGGGPDDPRDRLALNETGEDAFGSIMLLLVDQDPANS
ncbi:MAG: hypothetical protein JJT81_02820 [Rubellimicrobium sp.]|nr:hypothetical protein [Rubellimicrobium sp.]